MEALYVGVYLFGAFMKFCVNVSWVVACDTRPESVGRFSQVLCKGTS